MVNNARADPQFLDDHRHRNIVKPRSESSFNVVSKIAARLSEILVWEVVEALIILLILSQIWCRMNVRPKFYLSLEVCQEQFFLTCPFTFSTQSILRRYGGFVREDLSHRQVRFLNLYKLTG